MRGPDVWKHSGTLRDPESLPVIRKKFSIGRNPIGGEVEWFALMNLKALSHDEIDDDRLLPIGLPEAELVIEIEDDEERVGVRGTCRSSPDRPSRLKYRNRPGFASLGDLCGFDSVALHPCQQASLNLKFANAHRALRLASLE